MYESFFGLQEAPFSIAPNPHYLYMSKQHHEALAHLVFGVGREGGFVLLTGEVGTGKTTVCRCFLEQIPDNTDVAFILNPKLDCEQLLATICDELSISYIGDSMTVKEYIDYINEKLLSNHAKGRHTVLIIDEAQNLAPDVLEQLRLLTNLETHEKKLLQIVLLGQPELQDMFRAPELRQLSQRVTARFHLDALTKEELVGYVAHRLKVAGCPTPHQIFPKKSISTLFDISKGIPRVINLVCDRALLGAYTQELREVSPAVLKKAAEEVLGKPRLTLPKNNPLKDIISIPLLIQGLLLATLCGLGVFMGIKLAVSPVPGNDSFNASINASKNNASRSDLTVPAKNTSSSMAPTASEDNGAKAKEVSSGSVSVIAPGEMNQNSVELPPPSLETINLASSGLETKTVARLTNEPPPEVAANNESASSSPPTKPTSNEHSFANLLMNESQSFSEATAYEALLGSWGMKYDAQSDGFACNFAKKNGLACLNKIGSIGSLKHLGLPAVLTLFNEKGEKYYLMLRTTNGEKATISVQNKAFEIELDTLDKYWRGHFVMLWKVPPNYHGPLQPGTIGPMTRWLSKQLDTLEGRQQAAATTSYYDDEMVERVKLFQRQVGEDADGIVGINTLIQLSKLTDQSVPRLKLPVKDAL